MIDEAKKIADKLIAIRNDLHSYPELSFQEVKTSQYILNLLKQTGIDELKVVAKTGIVALLRGGRPGKTIALRADMDALPIHEENDVPYRSCNEGVMHACGHDIHMACLIGSAMILSKMKEAIRGNVKFLFQPAEEIFSGAKLMIDEGVMDQEPRVDAIVGMHVWHSLKLGSIGVRPGAMMASADKFEIRLKGPGGHGANPHLTSDPIVSASYIISSLQTIVSRNVDPIQPAVLSICKINAGKAFNIIPDELQMEGTIRALDALTRKKLIERLTDISQGVAKAFGLELVIDLTEGCPPLINDRNITQIIRNSALELLGERNVVEIEPTMGGEDFTYFTQLVPGAMFCLGVADEKHLSPVHTPNFDVSPDALIIGSAMLSKVVLTYLNSFN